MSKHWTQIHGWFRWRDAQEEAVARFGDGSRFVEVGTYLGRSLCSLAEVVGTSGKAIEIFGVDTCEGSGPEGPTGRDYHGAAVARGGGTFAGELHQNVLACGAAGLVTLVVAPSERAARLFADGSLAWVHLDARHDRAGLSADIAAWLPKVMPGGWLSGDDYDAEKWPEVVACVRERLPAARPWSTCQWRSLR